MKGRADACGHKTKTKIESEIPRICVDHLHTQCEQSKSEEKGAPTLVVKVSKTKVSRAWIAPRKGVDKYEILIRRIL